MDIDVKILDYRMLEADNLPKYATAGSAGMDLRACIEDEIVLKPGYVEKISTGIAINVKDPNYFALVAPRSGLGTNDGIVLANTVGIVDSDYQGCLMVALWNRGHREYTVKPMDRIAQLLILPVLQVNLKIVNAFSKISERGEGGFGSSGKK